MLQFLGYWKVAEHYSNAENETVDQCYLLEIKEVDDVSIFWFSYLIANTLLHINFSQHHREDTYSTVIDPHNYKLSMRFFQLNFSYHFHNSLYYVSINMTNTSFWNGNIRSVQVLKSQKSELLITVCEPKTSSIFLLSLHKSSKPMKVDKNSIKKITNSTMKARFCTKLHSTAGIKIDLSFNILILSLLIFCFKVCNFFRV